jgi:hypothetical protein
MFQVKDIDCPIIQKWLKLVGLVRHMPADRLDEAIVALEQIIKKAD